MNALNKLITSVLAIAVIFHFSAYETKSEEEYIVKITDKACECISKLPDTLSIEKLKLAVGVCTVEACSPYLKQLEEDYDVDFTAGYEEGNRFGQLIGVKLATHCPSVFAKFASQFAADEEQSYISVVSVTGKIIKMQNDDFVVFSLKDETGKIIKLYWQTFVESNIEMTANYPSLVGKTVTVEYVETEYFDPKIEQYRNYNIINSLTVSD